MGNLRVVHLVVKGRVQGVGFRVFVEEEASARSLDGWVRNRRDGSVEAVAAGSREAVESLIEALRRGPPAARVDAVEVKEADQAALGAHPFRRGFSLLPTV